MSHDMNDGFLGGPPRLFEAAGREQLIVLLEHGLCFDSFVLDVGCGALRGGRWVIPLLDPGHYCGIEPNRAMLERGLREFLDPEVVECKRPRFDGNDRFDFSVFGIRFTHVVARSVWTHASKQQIGAMLDGFAAHSASDGVFLASFLPAGESKAQEDYLGEAWVGRSHESDEPGMVGHAWRWVEEECAARGLEAQRLDRAPLTERGQVWCVVRHA